MANTYTQLLVQIVFAVQGRHHLIPEKHRNQLEKYICGIISNKNCKPLAIYCNPDHCHVLIGLNPSVSISSLTRDIKANSSKWINEQMWMQRKFLWQEGYGAFTYSRSHLDRVVQYILNQSEHHRKKTFREEYMDFLQKFQIDYNNEYLFEFLE